MPALTHGRVKNGFNGYATRVKLPNGGVSNTQPLRFNGGQQPKRNFKAEYNAQVNAPNALTNSIGSSFTTKRANARRAGDPDRKLLGLPEVSFSAPGQAGKKRKVPLSIGRRAKPVTGQLLATITVEEFPTGPGTSDPQIVGIDRDLTLGGVVYGSIVPPDINGVPNSVFLLVCREIGGAREIAAAQITGFAPAASNYQVNVKITNVTNNESQVYQMTVDVLTVPAIPRASIPGKGNAGWNGTMWAANDIVTVELV